MTPFAFVSASLGGKAAEFFLMRFVLAIVCAGCEARLFQVITRTTSPRIALFFLLIMTTSSGMFHASTAYLPSSFAMYTTMLGLADFMDWRTGKHTARGIVFFAIGAALGWPFIGALLPPFLIMEAANAFSTASIKKFIEDVTRGGIRSAGIVVS
jgi:alpha-1,2-mannosyltransferase